VSGAFDTQDCCLYGITHKRILEHALTGGNEAQIDPSTQDGKRFTKICGVPWPLLVLLIDKFQQWCTSNGNHFNLKAECPFKLWTIACFRKMRTGGSMTQFREGYNIGGSVFHEFFHLFLDWHWDIKDLHIKIPMTKEEIDKSQMRREHRLCFKCVIASPPSCFGLKTILRDIFLLVPILFRVTHTVGLWVDSRCVRDSLFAARVYPMICTQYELQAVVVS
jgi:hypothetical protein